MAVNLLSGIVTGIKYWFAIRRVLVRYAPLLDKKICKIEKLLYITPDCCAYLIR